MSPIFLLYARLEAVVIMYDLGLSHLLVTISGAHVLSFNCMQSHGFSDASSLPVCQL